MCARVSESRAPARWKEASTTPSRICTFNPAILGELPGSGEGVSSAAEAGLVRTIRRARPGRIRGIHTSFEGNAKVRVSRRGQFSGTGVGKTSVRDGGWRGTSGGEGLSGKKAGLLAIEASQQLRGQGFPSATEGPGIRRLQQAANQSRVQPVPSLERHHMAAEGAPD